MDDKRERLFSKDYIIIMLAATGTCFVNYFFFSTLAPYIKLLRDSTFQAGVLTAVYSLAALASRPISGVISDKIGRVKLLILGAAVCAGACASFGLTTNFVLMVIIHGLNGIGFGIHSTCAGAVVADIVPKSRLTEGIGYFGLYNTIAQMIAPTIAIWITTGHTLKDYRLLFFTAMGLCLISTVCNCFLTYEKRRKRAEIQAEAEPVKTVAEPDAALLPKTLFGFEYAVFAPVAVLILIQLGLSSLMSYITSYAQEMRFGNVGLFFTFTAIGAFVSRMIFGRITDKRGSDIVIIPGTLVIAVCLAAIPLMKSKEQLELLAVPLGLAQGAALPTFNSMLFRRCSAARRGTASGAFFSAIDIGFAVGAPLLGFIADELDYRYMYRAAGIFAALGLVLYVLIASDKRYKARQIKSAGKV